MELMLAFFGAILIVTAIVGGGFEIREIRMPQVGWLACSATV